MKIRTLLWSAALLLTTALLGAAGAALGHAIALSLDVGSSHGPVAGKVTGNDSGSSTYHKISVQYTDLNGTLRNGWDYVSEDSLVKLRVGDSVQLLYSDDYPDQATLSPSSISWHVNLVKHAKYFGGGGLAGLSIAAVGQFLVVRHWLRRPRSPEPPARPSPRRG